MKPPRPKIHIQQFAAPLATYSGIAVICGVTLAHAEPKWMLTDANEIGDWRFVGVCSRCFKMVDLLEHLDLPPTYLYGLVDAQASLDAEKEEG